MLSFLSHFLHFCGSDFYSSTRQSLSLTRLVKSRIQLNSLPWKVCPMSAVQCPALRRFGVDQSTHTLKSLAIILGLWYLVSNTKLSSIFLHCINVALGEVCSMQPSFPLHNMRCGSPVYSLMRWRSAPHFLHLLKLQCWLMHAAAK